MKLSKRIRLTSSSSKQREEEDEPEVVSPEKIELIKKKQEVAQQHHLFLHKRNQTRQANRTQEVIRKNVSLPSSPSTEKTESEIPPGDGELSEVYWGKNYRLPKFQNTPSICNNGKSQSADAILETSKEESKINMTQSQEIDLPLDKLNLTKRFHARRKEIRSLGAPLTSIKILSPSDEIPATGNCNPQDDATTDTQSEEKKRKRSNSMPVLKTWERLEDVVESSESNNMALQKTESTDMEDPLLDDFLALLNRSDGCYDKSQEKNRGIIKEGYLFMNDRVWCVLTKKNLFIYSSQSSDNPKDILSLATCQVRTKSKSGKHKLILIDNDTGKKVSLITSTFTEAREWVISIDGVIYTLKKSGKESQIGNGVDVISRLKAQQRLSRKPSDPLLMDFVKLLQSPPQSQSRSRTTSTSSNSYQETISIEFDEDNIVKSATPLSLLELLFNDDYNQRDPDYSTILFLTYRYFITPVELFEFIVNYGKMKKAIGLLYLWANINLPDLLTSKEMQLKIHNFAYRLSDYGEELALKELLHGKTTSPSRTSENTLRKIGKMMSVKPTMLRNSLKSESTRDFLFFSPKELAEQLTIYEHELFCSIPISECLNQNWNDPNPELYAPNLMNYIGRFNKMSQTVATDILQAQTLDQRVIIIKRYISIAKRCYGFNNFNTSMEICCGLNLASISRLKNTWSEIPKKYMNVFAKLNEIYTPDGNYKNYRQIIKNKSAPITPYLALSLRDLTLIELHNKTKNTNNQINLPKLRLISGILAPIRKLQQVNYPINRNDEIQNFIRNFCPLNEEELYRKSIQCETHTFRRMTAC